MNDTDEPIDIEELTRDVENLLRDRPAALKKLRANAERLAARVVADAALLRDVREALEDIYRQFARSGERPYISFNDDFQAVLAKLETTS